MTPRTRALLIAAVILGGAAFFSIGTAIGYHGAAALFPPRAYKPVAASDFVREWKRSPAAAIERYGRDGVMTRGRLTGMGENDTRQTYLILNDAPDQIVVFVLSDGARRQLAKCKTGDDVTVWGVASDGVNETPRLIAERIE